MGFPSPATDYIEHRLTPERICGVSNDTRILETSSGYALIEPVTKLAKGQVLLILADGRTQFARFTGHSLLCNDGQLMNDAEAQEVEVMGRVSFFINRAVIDDCPV